jgi:DNA-binding XRE family transcriptional regulator
MARRFNYRRVKIHHSYTIAELAALLGVHKHTVRR